MEGNTSRENKMNMQAWQEKIALLRDLRHHVGPLFNGMIKDLELELSRLTTFEIPPKRYNGVYCNSTNPNYQIPKKIIEQKLLIRPTKEELEPFLQQVKMEMQRPQGPERPQAKSTLLDLVGVRSIRGLAKDNWLNTLSEDERQAVESNNKKIEQALAQEVRFIPNSVLKEYGLPSSQSHLLFAERFPDTYRARKQCDVFLLTLIQKICKIVKIFLYHI